MTAVHSARQAVKGGAQQDPLVSEVLASEAFTLLLKLLYTTQTHKSELRAGFVIPNVKHVSRLYKERQIL